MAEKSNYNLFEIDWFAEILKAYSPDDIRHPDPSEIEAYKGKLPDCLLEFWSSHGWCSWTNGQYWLCDPKMVKPIIDYVFLGDPEIDPNKMFAFGYTAFGEIDIWDGNGQIRLSLPRNKVRIEPRAFDEEHQRYDTDEMIIGGRLSGRVSPDLDVWEDENYQDMMPQALERVGALKWGEIYGFVPALSMGGRNTVAYLQKQPLVEHLVFLASMEPPTLYDYIPPKEGEGGVGNVVPVRQVGPQ